MPASIWARVAAVAAIVVLIDQVTKAVVLETITEDIHVFGPLTLTLLFNNGIAFGLSQGWLAMVLVLVALAIIVGVMIKQRASLRGLAVVAVGLVLGGALGNLLDRVFRDNGAVVDFIALSAGSFHWPVFNVADIAVVVGAFSLAIAGARSEPAPADSQPE